ncbi:hypothetical protein LSH36_68g00006 [Paralvinella palmiformis]|uniref:SH3 domain-containing protein n=1 Tax=Paralvinella palmiformis TaxID=53620 RepID=A0AAD9ND23_9ANNE|nr:hypothetical protein LSH36_68g00006 [Paralvinella palmiformis]
METGDDVEEPLGRITGHLDFNDNTHILGHRKMENTQKMQTLTCPNESQNESRSMKMVGKQSSPNHCASHTSATSDNKQQVPGQLYSPEDNLNNDFFYDDEFAIQFDATLGGINEAVMDSVELSKLLNLTGDDNQKWRSKMMASKSDSCLYQAELDFSSCSDPNATSSERELLTSSDMSDFKAEPLFSPPPSGDLDDSCMALQSDSICNEELAGSLMKDEDRYAFDWTANKDQYMISFDRSPTRTSVENLERETFAKHKFTKRCKELTYWGRVNGGQKTHQEVRGEVTSGSQGSSGSGPCSMVTSSNPPNSDAGSSNDLPASPVCITVSNGNNSSRLSSTDTSTSSTMTTWKLLRQNKGKGKLPDGMTTWQHIKEGAMCNSVAQRSKSMPNLQSQQQKDSAVGNEMGATNMQEEMRPKRYSASLLEMFRQLRAQQGIVQPYTEPEGMEPLPTRRFELDTWSMSPASSHQMSPPETTNHSMENSITSRDGNIAPRDQGDVKNECRVDQHVPSLNDCGVQTSIDKTTKPSRLMKQNKSLQTSMELLTGAHVRIHRRQHRGYPNLVRKMPRPYSTGSLSTRRETDDDRFTVHLSKQARERMTRSLFFKSTILPDLGFLSKHMSYSTANLMQTFFEPPKDKKPMPSVQTPVIIPEQSPAMRCPPAGYRPKKPPRQHRAHSVGHCHSRESSPVVQGAKHRSRSTDSGSSFCSSSSSGIDPGSYESHKSLHYFMEQHSRQDDQYRAYYQNSAGKDQSMAASHPSYKKSNSEGSFPSWTGCDCAPIAQVYLPPSFCCLECVPCMCMMQEFYSMHAFECQDCHQLYLNADCQYDQCSADQNSKPLKSCLVKKHKADNKMLAFKRRSWSDPSDGLVLKYSQEGQIKYQLITHDKECKQRHPLSEIEVHEHSAESNDQTNQEKTEQILKAKLPCCRSEGSVPTPQASDVVVHDEKKTVPSASSPEQIPVPPCTCGVTHAILHSSSESGDDIGQSCTDIYRSKKSVSFSEEISYHSPYNSPHHSPQRQVQPVLAKDTGTGLVIRHPVGRHLSSKKRPVSLPPNFRLVIPGPVAQPIPEDPSCESPPKDFSVSPPVSALKAPLSYETNEDLSDKKYLICDMAKVIKILTDHFCEMKSTQEKPELADSDEVTDISHIVLELICPAVYAIIQDGLKPHVRSLFGKVKNTPWRVVEDSVDLAVTSHLIRNLVHDLKSLDFLTTAWLKFNAFVFGLLNNRALDLWFNQLHVNIQLLQKHYEVESFLLLTTTPTAEPLFLDLITTIQPLKADKTEDHKPWLQYQKQTVPAEQESQTGSLSPIRGELSPVQGEAGQPQGMLHHSAPADYQKQQMMLYSPTKAKWNSLYNKVQQLKTSDIAQQTKTLVTESFKSLKDSTTLKLSKDALQHLGQDLVHVAVGYSSPIRALPNIPGLTVSEDSTGMKHSNSSSGSSTIVDKGPPHRVMSVLENNELIIYDQDEKDDLGSRESLIQRVSQRLVGYNSPQKVYKQGITEYQFSTKTTVRPNSLGSSKSLDSLAKPPTALRNVSLKQRKSLFDENGMPRCSSLDESIEFQIPTRVDSSSSPSTPPENKNRNVAQSKSHARKLSKTLGTSLRKSWSSFGPKLVSFMDHLLLDESKSKSNRKLSTATTSSSSTSSGSSSPPSVIIKTDTSKTFTTAHSVFKRSASAGPCQSSTSPTELCHVEDASESGNCGTVNSDETTSTEASGIIQKNVLPSTDSDQNWFVQALCHHVAMQDDQLSFDKGTVFAVIKEIDSDWLLCRHGNKEGLVHTACVTKA